MKQLVLKLVLPVAVLLVSSANIYCFSQSASVHEAVIGCPGISEKLVPDVQQSLEQMDGVRVIRFLENDDVFLLTYEADTWPDRTALVTSVQQAFPRLTFVLKEGASHKELLDSVSKQR